MDADSHDGFISPNYHKLQDSNLHELECKLTQMQSWEPLAQSIIMSVFKWCHRNSMSLNFISPYSTQYTLLITYLWYTLYTFLQFIWYISIISINIELLYSSFLQVSFQNYVVKGNKPREFLNGHTIYTLKCGERILLPETEQWFNRMAYLYSTTLFNTLILGPQNIHSFKIKLRIT